MAIRRAPCNSKSSCQRTMAVLEISLLAPKAKTSHESLFLTAKTARGGLEGLGPGTSKALFL